MAPSRRFPRRLRLKRRRLLRPLFRRGAAQTVAAGCIRLLFRRVPRALLPPDAPLQVAFVPGRQRGAVVRNRVRRALREAYRHHHARLMDRLSLGPADGVALAVLFRGTVDRALHAHVAADLPRALDRLAAEPAFAASSHN